MKTRLKRFLRFITISCGVLLLLGAILWLAIPRCALYRDDLTWSPVLRDREGKVLHLGLAKDERYRIRVPLSEVSPTMIRATLAFEDEHYFSHPGVNPFSMMRALMGRMQGVSRGGGSTISMQYARLRFGLSTRTISGKIQQMLCAIQLEKYYTKQQILEAYLNTAPYGGNVEGVAAASLRWCGHDCLGLDIAKSVALVMLPQRPALRRPRPGREEVASTRSSRRRLLEKLGYHDGLLGDYAWEHHSVPREAPHVARRLRHADEWSSLDHDTQSNVETAVRDYLLRVQEKGVSNAAVVVVDAPTREVRSYVGSADFSDAKIEGQVDVIRAKRSPGSLYKPFLYGLAIDQGLLHPQTMLADAPMRFRDYNPENYERDFLGPVKAGEALYRSRNLPALSLMRRIRGHGLFDYLQQSGVRMNAGPDEYGLALALGAAEATPEEMAMLYASLADDGVPRSLVYQRGKSPASHRRLPMLTDGTRWLLRHMLADRSSGDPLMHPTHSYKTGTSQGFRDAWAIGMSGHTVIVVWIGHSDGRSNAAFEGRAMAAPLLSDLFRRLKLLEVLPPPPVGVRKVELCAVSGMIPCEHCRHREPGWVLPDVSPIVPCDLHRLVWVDQVTGMRVAPRDGDPRVKAEICEFWSPEFLDLFRLAGMPRRTLLESAEVFSQSNEAPQILSPMREHLYQISGTSAQGLICKARAAAGVSRLFWFGNDVFLGSCAPGDAFIWNDASGPCELHVMDDRGMSSSISVLVERKR
ncbi:MAG: penicillin-binding protein 1C [Akkermansiaceae bacterium]